MSLHRFKTKFSAHIPKPRFNAIRERLVTGKGRVHAPLAAALFSLGFAFAPAASAQSVGPVPENAQADSYGSGWSCEPGFQKQDQTCVEVDIPENAYLTKTTYGKGWDCSFGYLEKRGQCVAVQLPENAHLDSYTGDQWKCLRGYRENNGRCDLIEIPENAFLSDKDRQRGWECERGYVANGNRCDMLKVPENGYLTTNGDEWRCNRAFEKKGDACVAVKIPENAYFVDKDYGRKWKCDRGFEKVGLGCSPVKVPANAHLDWSGNGWECSRPYRRRNETCALE